MGVCCFRPPCPDCSVSTHPPPAGAAGRATPTRWSIASYGNPKRYVIVAHSLLQATCTVTKRIGGHDEGEDRMPRMQLGLLAAWLLSVGCVSFDLSDLAGTGECSVVFVEHPSDLAVL